MVCPSCGYDNRPGVIFCENCGSRFASPPVATSAAVPVVRAVPAVRVPVRPAGEQRCPNCGSACQGNFQFCPSCGYALQETAAYPDTAPEPSRRQRPVARELILFAVKAVVMIVLGIIVGWLIIFVF